MANELTKASDKTRVGTPEWNANQNRILTAQLVNNSQQTFLNYINITTSTVIYGTYIDSVAFTKGNISLSLFSFIISDDLKELFLYSGNTIRAILNIEDITNIYSGNPGSETPFSDVDSLITYLISY
jgi:hypothetical protein